jgi:isocitrate/isopropylmalate dehydrogenase
LGHIGAEKGANAIEAAVNTALEQGYRTADIASSRDDEKLVLGTAAMGEKILSYL